MTNYILIQKLENILHEFKGIIHLWWNPLDINYDEEYFDNFDNKFDEKYSICFKKFQKLVNCEIIYNYNKVSAWYMFKISKSSEDWKTMSTEDKQIYQTLADQENDRRRKKAEIDNILVRLTEDFTLDSHKPLLKTSVQQKIDNGCNIIIPENMFAKSITIFSDFLDNEESYNALKSAIEEIEILFSPL